MPSGFTRRTDWSDLPATVVRSLERSLGSTVVGSEPVHGGMSPGPATLLSLADGRLLFAKAARGEPDGLVAKTRALHAREVDVLRSLPVDVPHAPLVTTVDRDDWLVVVTEAARGGVVGPPWRSQDLAAVADVLDAVAVHRDLPGLAPAIDRLPSLDGWDRLASTSPEVLDAWERAHLGTLVAMSDGWRTWTAGRHLVHLDVRCDNVVRDGEQVWLVDWAHAAVGAPWLDHACLAVDVVASGHLGGDRVAVSAARGILAGLPYEATRLVVAVAGMFRASGLRPPVPTVPALRDWQIRRARALRPLLERLISR